VVPDGSVAPREDAVPKLGDYFADLFRRTNSFSNWRIVESFDSANDCEKVRVRDFTSDEARKAQTVLAPEPKSEGKAPEPKAEAKVKAVMDAFARAVRSPPTTRGSRSRFGCGAGIVPLRNSSRARMGSWCMVLRASCYFGRLNESLLRREAA
jgi:hypothetical protein